MASPPILINKYQRRQVATSSSKACWVCYKPSCTVLITPDNKDFFYVCPGHLIDRNFAVPDATEVAAIEAKKKQTALIKQGEREYEEIQKQRKLKQKSKDNEKDGNAGKDGEKASVERTSGDATAVVSPSPDIVTATTDTEEEPRSFSLTKSFFQQRWTRIRDADLAKKNRERLRNPNLFPSVPTGAPSKSAEPQVGQGPDG